MLIDKDSKSKVLETILNLMDCHAYWKDKHGKYLWCNKKLAEVYGLKDSKKIIGKTDYDLYSAKLAKAVVILDKSILNTGKKYQSEEIGFDSENKKAIYLSIKAPTKDELGNINGLIGISIDITARKQAEIAKQEFMMNMAHDLRTPLAGIIGLSSIQYAGEQLLELLNSVIELTAAEHIVDRVKQERIDLIKLAEELHNLIQPTVHSKNLTFQLKIDPKLPIIISDRIKLKRILLNILSNALKFTKQGKISLEINLVAIKNQQVKIKIIISDTGIGIPKDKQDKIFDRFYRAHPSNLAEYSGYGLGLHLVKKSTEALGGTINVSSIEGEGSCFSLEFNFVLAEPADSLSVNNSALSSDEELQSLATLKLKGSVLVAEDNTLVAYVVKKLLNSFGCQVEIASTGEAALQILQTQTFNCGLLDIGLPGLDGIEVIRRYREWELINNKPYLPIFALTAHAEEKVKQECQAAGCDQVLLKPFTEKNVKTIEKFLQ